MSDSGIKIEVHLIQNFAPSNLNRDDTGQPKSSTFGGFRRARISSQCSKRSARALWRERASVTVGDRTKKLQQLICERLDQDDEFSRLVVDKEDRKCAARVFTQAYYAASAKNKPENTSVLIFISPDEVDVCAQTIKELWPDHVKEAGKRAGKKGAKAETIEGIGSIVKKIRTAAARKSGEEGSSGEPAKAAEEAVPGEDQAKTPADEVGGKKETSAPTLKPVKEIEDRIKAAKVSADIALFGRMLAEQPGRNTDGSCQVAHPISTHKVDMEMDFYTAVDDLNPKEEPGAGMMGVVGFNSACYYRYALVDRDQLARNLARKTERKNGQWTQELTKSDYAEAEKVIRAFLEAMVYAIPTGKQNSFAAQNLPAFGLFVRRKGGVPLSLANAFAKPIRPVRDDDDLIGLSVAALTRHWGAIQAVYGDQGVSRTGCFHVEQADRLNGLGDCAKNTAKEAIDAVVEVAR